MAPNPHKFALTNYSRSVYYKHSTIGQLKLDQQGLGLGKYLLAGAHDGRLPLPAFNPAVPTSWDGVGLLPTYSQEQARDPERLINTALEDCQVILRGLGFDLAISDDCFFDPAHYKLLPERERVALFTGSGDQLVPVHFELGGLNVGVSAQTWRANFPIDGTRFLEPAGALYLITQYLHHVARITARKGGQPPSAASFGMMLVDCAGALYSPSGNDKWNDVLRWEVFPPMNGQPGLVVLSWNWDPRRRAAQGVGIARDARIR